MELDPEMLFCLIGLGLTDSLEQLGEAPVDCDAFVGSIDVAASDLLDRPILIGGIGVAWSLGFTSATIPFVAKEKGAWSRLLLQVLKRI